MTNHPILWPKLHTHPLSVHTEGHPANQTRLKRASLSSCQPTTHGSTTTRKQWPQASVSWTRRDSSCQEAWPLRRCSSVCRSECQGVVQKHTFYCFARLRRAAVPLDEEAANGCITHPKHEESVAVPHTNQQHDTNPHISIVRNCTENF